MLNELPASDSVGPAVPGQLAARRFGSERSEARDEAAVAREYGITTDSRPSHDCGRASCTVTSPGERRCCQLFSWAISQGCGESSAIPS